MFHAQPIRNFAHAVASPEVSLRSTGPLRHAAMPPFDCGAHARLLRANPASAPVRRRGRCMPYVADRVPRIPTLRVLPTAAACSALNNASSAAPTCGLYSFTPQGAAAAGAGSCELHTQSASGRDFAPTLNGMVGCGPYQPRPPRSVPPRADFTRRSCSARKAVFLLGASVSRRASGAARTVRRALESGRKRRRK